MVTSVECSETLRKKTSKSQTAESAIRWSRPALHDSQKSDGGRSQVTVPYDVVRRWGSGNVFFELFF